MNLKHQNRPCNRSLGSRPPFLYTPTYMHLRIELLGGGGGGVGPRHVVVGGHVEVAVDRVPAVAAGGPGQRGSKGRQQVVQGPRHDGVVVEGDVEGDDADGEADPCEQKERRHEKREETR